MIIEGPVLDLVRFDTYDEDEAAWVEWTPDLNSLDIERGGRRDGVTTTVEVGILTATLVNAGNPLTDTRIRPNVRVRAVTPYTSLAEFNTAYLGMDVGDFNTAWDEMSVGQFNATFQPLIPIFAGRILDIVSGFRIDKSTGEKTRLVTLTAVDAVGAHASVTQNGAVTDGGVGYESWAQRIIRLSASATTEVETPEDDSPIVRYAL